MKKINHMKNYLTILIVLFLVSCQSKKDQDDVMIPAITSYKEGLEKFKKSDFKEAANLFGRVYFQHPGGDITPYAELMEAYSLYNARMYEDAVDVLDNFIVIHPSHPDIAYAYYLKSLCSYMQISDIHHDQGRTEEAKRSFEEVINRFPESRYALDASIKMDLVNDHLAGKEMEIGRYYQNRQNPIGAISRFEEVVHHYATTTHIPEALFRVAEAYSMLGLDKEARKYVAVLAYNYPNTQWYIYAKSLIGAKTANKE